MARLFNVNQPITSGQYAGQSLFNWKNLAVAGGFTVRGSGDGGTRFAWNGVTPSLPLAQQGSGGEYDCWLTGAVRTDASSVVAGDAGNARAWCVLEDGAGRQALIQMTSTTTGAPGQAVLGFARAGSGGFDPLSGPASATTSPGSPSAGAGSEVFMLSTTRNGVGAAMFPTLGGYVHMWTDTTPGVDGGLPLGWYGVDNAGAGISFGIFAPFVAGTSSADIDPYLYAALIVSPFILNLFAWDWAAGPTYTLRSMNTINMSDFWIGLGQLDPITAQGAITPAVWVTSGNECAKGVIHSTSSRMAPTVRSYGHFGEDQNSVGWLQAGETCFPWPDAATAPLPSSTLISFRDVGNMMASPFAQRVWSTGTSVWCYYVGAIDPSPASTATIPNWVTSAIRHEVLGPT